MLLPICIGISFLIALSLQNCIVSWTLKWVSIALFRCVNSPSFSDTSIENPIYYPGPEDLNSKTINLILACNGYSEDLEVVTDTLQLVNATLGINTPTSAFKVSVYPNPISKNGSFIVESSTVDMSTIKQIQLINMYGQIVKVEQPNVIDNNSISVVCDYLPNGVYFLMLDGIRTSKKIIVNN